MNATRELWHAAGRAARDDRKRLLALQGLLWSFPLLVLGSLCYRLPNPEWAGLKRPLHYVLEPLASAWRTDQDLHLLGYVALQGLLLAMLWGLFGGAVYRLAAVDLARRPREGARDALAFARRHWRGFTGARVAFWLGFGVPVVAAVALASTGRLPGAFGGVLLVVAIGVAVLCAIAAVVVFSIDLVAGFLTGPTVACEDSDAFDAVARTFTYASAGLPRLTWLRLLFLGGVLLGSGWRLVRGLAIAAVAWIALRAGAGADTLDGAMAILGATGAPPDADRLGLEWYHHLVALALAMAAGSLVILWLADLVSRVLCARTGIYLLMRHEVDKEPLTNLRTAPRGRGRVGAEEAGFVEVSKVEGP